MGVSVAAYAQSGTVPDAQIESNVLRALASAPELSTQNIQSSTVYGVVTLSGNVHDEAMRTKAENLAARAAGVKKVVDQLTLGDTPPPTDAANGPQSGSDQQAMNQSPDPNADQAVPPAGQVLLSDGTYGPAPDGSGAAPAPQQSPNQAPPPAQNGGQSGPPPMQRRPMYNGYGPGGPRPDGRPVPGGQQAGLEVTVPAGSVLRIRINRGLDSQHIQPGANFDGTVLTDVVAGGAVAIPRGATVQGTVVDAKKAGVFKGEGELALQITSLTLGGNVYPVTSEVWQRNGGDKTAGTVNRTAGGAALGAVFGALAGGGTGAAIGAGVGGGLGLGSAAASPRGQIIVPPESVLTFRMAQPSVVRTVSEAEMARLSYAAGPGAPPQRPMRRYYSPYYGYYYAPAY
jgi:hypothetical protein